MSKENSSGGFKFNGWGTAGIAALLVVGGFFAKNYFNSPSISITGNNNQNAGRDINTNTTTVYGSADSLLVVPAKSPTITAVREPVSSSVSVFDYALQVVEPPILLKPMLQTTPDSKASYNVVGVQRGKEYTLNFVVNYRSIKPTKYYANVVPDSENRELWSRAHMDNISVTGRALQGDGSMRFSLRGVAPTESGLYQREVTMGLMDYENWQTQGSLVHYSFPFLLSVGN
jgi:hypothetical protein